MSSINKRRIKGLRKYSQSDNSTPFSSLIPFGTDGDLVDIFSNLDLEEQLLLGGQKTISFEEDNEQLIVKEKLYNKAGMCCYSKKTNLTSAPSYQLIQVEEDPQESQLGYQEEQELQEVFIGDFLGRLQLEIKVQLYKGDFDDPQNSKLLHTKNITFDSINQTFEERIQDFNQEEEEP